jgi:hypothetical protein
MRLLRFLSVIVLCLICGVALAAPPVELELVTEPGFPVGGERRWVEALGDLPDTTLRIRGGRSGDQPLATAREGGGFRVVGLLSSRNTLKLPGGTFDLDDSRGIRAWLERLRNEGADNLTAPRGAFGLTGEQLVEVNEALQIPVDFSSLDLSAAEFVERLSSRLALPLDVDAHALQILEGDKVREELVQFSAGTALAIALRPCGLVLTVERRGPETRLRVVAGEDAKEFWPVGWKSDQSPRVLQAQLFKFLEVESTTRRSARP